MSDDVDQVEPTMPTDKLPRETPVFVSDQPPGREAEIGSDEFGRPEKTIQAESIEAAQHWDRRIWHRR